MNTARVSLPDDKATWSRADVEKYLNDKGPEFVFGANALKEWATKSGLHPAGSVAGFMRMPAAVFPELAALTDPKGESHDLASVYVDPQAATVFGTDGKIGLRVAVNKTVIEQKAVPVKAVDSLIPKTAGRTPFRFDAHVLLRLCLSALASVGGQPCKSDRSASVTLWVDHADAGKPVRVEVANESGQIQMVGVLMPMVIEAGEPTTDPLGIRPEPLKTFTEQVADL